MLDSYDPFTKWHTFAFRADRDRLGEFRTALEPWVSYRDLVPLIAFRDRHATHRDPIDPNTVSNEAVQALFARCIELVVREPNVGYGRLYGMVDDMLVPYGIPLVDPEWPVHYLNADGGPVYVYGTEGFEISVLDGNDRDDVAAFELSLDEIKHAALDMVANQLSDEGVDLDMTDEDAVRDIVEQDYADRAAFMCRQLFAEWHRQKTSLLEALDDVRSNRCAMLHWSAKNPAL
ncbi:MAG: hypothetical protein QM831_22845 [Kofleriaceae bacterium]